MMLRRCSNGQSLENMNDVINAVCFPCDEGPREIHESSIQFQWFSVMEDGIDLLYYEYDGVLQLVVPYRKLVTWFMDNTPVSQLLVDSSNLRRGPRYKCWHLFFCLQFECLLPQMVASSKRSQAWQKKYPGYFDFLWAPNDQHVTGAVLRIVMVKFASPQQKMRINGFPNWQFT